MISARPNRPKAEVWKAIRVHRVRSIPATIRSRRTESPILVLGILSFAVCPPILGPIAWVMGNQSMRDIRMGIMDPREEGLINAGRIIGMVMTCLALLAVVIYCGFFVLIIGLGAAGAAGA